MLLITARWWSSLAVPPPPPTKLVLLNGWRKGKPPSLLTLFVLNGYDYARKTDSIQYTVDNLIREWGHEVIRLPPAHTELNAIEQLWGCMKRYVRSSLRRFTRASLRARIEAARLCATTETWRDKKFEEDYWSSENIHDCGTRHWHFWLWWWGWAIPWQRWWLKWYPWILVCIIIH